MKVGLVLGAGGNVGRAYHAGVLAALEDVMGWDPREADVIVGTSAGSLDGALLRAGLRAADLCAHTAGEPLSEEGEALLRHAPGPIKTGKSYPWTGKWRPSSPECILRAARRPWSISFGALAAAALPEGVVPTGPIHELLRPLFGTRWPRKPLWITTVRLDDGRRVVFGKNPQVKAAVDEAVAASCSIPGWFCPARIGGARYVDGGSYSLTNCDLLQNLDLDLIVVSSPMSAVRDALHATVDGALRAASHLRLRTELSPLWLRTRVLVLEPSEADLAVMGTLGEAMDNGRRPAVALHVRRSMSERLRLVQGADVLRYATRIPMQVHAP